MSSLSCWYGDVQTKTVAIQCIQGFLSLLERVIHQPIFPSVWWRCAVDADRVTVYLRLDTPEEETDVMNRSTLYIWNLWSSCQIRKIVGCACTWNAGNVFPATAGQRSRHASRHVRDARAVIRSRLTPDWGPHLLGGPDLLGGTHGPRTRYGVPDTINLYWHTYGVILKT